MLLHSLRACDRMASILASVTGIVVSYRFAQYDLKLKRYRYVLSVRARRQTFSDEQSGGDHACCDCEAIEFSHEVSQTVAVIDLNECIHVYSVTCFNTGTILLQVIHQSALKSSDDNNRIAYPR